MAGAERNPVGLGVEFGTPEDRLPVLLDHVARLRPDVAGQVGFVDLGGNGLELLLTAVEPQAFTRWVQQAVASGRVTRLWALGDLAQRSDGQFADPARRGIYRRWYMELSERALGLLAVHGAEVPDDIVARELLRIHASVSGDHARSMRWQVGWLHAVRDEGPWPDPGDGAVLLTARLAHGHWLRLSGAENTERVEIDAFEALISTQGAVAAEDDEPSAHGRGQNPVRNAGLIE